MNTGPAPQLHVALVQAQLLQGDTQGNLAHLEELLAAHLQPGQVHLIVLPEMFNTGYDPQGSGAEAPGMHTSRWLALMAQRYQAVLVGSLALRVGPHLHNRLLWQAPQGPAQHYDKRHLFGFAGEDKAFTAGSERPIFSVAGWRVCPAVCFDLRFPVWARNTALQPYHLYVCVANWPSARVQAWDALLPARAIENACYSLGLNRCGHDEQNQIAYPGHSQVHTAKGDCLLHMGSSEGVAVATLQLADLEAYWAKFPVLQAADTFQLLP